MVEQKGHPYRIAAPVEQLTSLEERALILADKLETFPERFPKQPNAVFHFEREILNLLKEASFKKKYHEHFVEADRAGVSCIRGFFRGATVVLISFTTIYRPPMFHNEYKELCFRSGLYAIAGRKEILEQNKKLLPWYSKLHQSLWNELDGRDLNSLRKNALKSYAASLLYIARSAQRQ